MVTKSSNVSQYVPKRSRECRPVPPEETEALRAKVPDDPIKVPPGHLACEGCGIAHAGPVVESLPVVTSQGRTVATAEYTRCPDCQRLHEKAGDRRTLVVLYALSVIGQKPPEDPTPLVSWMQVIADAVPWADPEAPSRDLCNRHRWAHVSLSQRVRIKEAYLLAMRSRVSLSAPAVRLPPPWSGACLFCGLGSLPMAAIEVVRRGGREVAAHSVWRRLLVSPDALGGRGPDLVDGFLCPPCSEALDDTGAAVGLRARARAFEKHVRSTRSPAEADLVRAAFAGEITPSLPGWGGLAATSPNPEPWAHIEIEATDEPVPEAVS